MKKSVLLFILLCLSFSIFAQNGISFQGIARDASGNAIPNQSVSVKFTIGSFTETQTIATDNFGIFSATIGSVNTTAFNSLVFANISEKLKVEVEGNIIYDDKFNTVPYAKSADNGVPPGSIMPFAGPANKIPAGWLVCNGQSVSKTGIYQKLYEAIGTSWGDDGGNFKVPDLRGMFLRGTNEGRSDTFADPATRTVGNIQTSDNKSHSHTGTTSQNGSHNHSNGTYTKALQVTGSYTVENWDSSDTEPDIMHEGSLPYDGAHTHTVTTNDTGITESRPNNAAVVYIIKY